MSTETPTGPVAAPEGESPESLSAHSKEEPSVASDEQQAPRPRILKAPPGPFFTRDRKTGLSLVLVSFVLAVGISWKSKEASLPRVGSPPAAVTTEGIAGFPKNVQLLPNLPLARSLTPRTELVGVSAKSTTALGVDVAGKGTVTYRFRSLQGEGPEAPRPFGALARRRYCGVQEVLISGEGIGAQADKPKARCESAQPVLPEPRCTIAQLWKTALAKGLDADKPARLEYYMAQAGPAWRVHGQDASAVLTIGADCNAVLTEEQAKRK